MKKKIKNEKENDIQESCLSPEKKKGKKKYPTVHRPHDMRNQHRSRA